MSVGVAAHSWAEKEAFSDQRLHVLLQRSGERTAREYLGAAHPEARDPG